MLDALSQGFFQGLGAMAGALALLIPALFALRGALRVFFDHFAEGCKTFATPYIEQIQLQGTALNNAEAAIEDLDNAIRKLVARQPLPVGVDVTHRGPSSSADQCLTR
jgi:hypothetical protein